MNETTINKLKNAIDSLFWDIQNRDKQIIKLNQDREKYFELFKFFNNIYIILNDGQTHHFDGDFNKFHHFVSDNLFQIKSITIQQKEKPKQ